MTSKLKLLACQLAVPPVATVDARDRFLEETAAKIGRALARTPADLVVLPELSGIDYHRTAFERLDRLAEPLEGPSFELFRALAREHEVAIAYGIPRLADDGYRITQVVVGEEGQRLGHFDKIHIAQYGASFEKEYFTRGRHLFVFEHRGIRIAPIICYDIRIPELSRTLALDHGVQLILHCGAYARDESFHSWHDFVVSRAMENQIYMLSLNRAGEDFGNSLFCGPWVDEESPATPFPERAEALVSLTIDPASIEAVRQRYSFLRDRLDDYRSLPSDPAGAATRQSSSKRLAEQPWVAALRAR